MHWSDVRFDAPSRVLRQFATLWIVAFAALAARKFFTGHEPTAFVLVSIGLIVGIPGLVRPKAIRYVYGAAMAATFPIGWIVSQALLIVIFYGVFTPVALVFRLFGRDILHRKFSSQDESYWEPRKLPASADRYFPAVLIDGRGTNSVNGCHADDFPSRKLTHDDYRTAAHRIRKISPAASQGRFLA